MSTATIADICSECGDHFEDCYCGNVADCDECGHPYEEAELHYDRCPDCCENRFSRMVRDRPHEAVDWAAWGEYAEHVKGVDFGCNFDCDGRCASTRAEGSWGSGRAKKACCVGCGHNHGYLDAIPAEALELVEALFNDEHGFWRPGGCILPHKYRSSICLRYKCGSKARRDGSDNDGLTQLDVLSDIMAMDQEVARLEQRLQLPRQEQFGNEEQRLKSAKARLYRLKKKRVQFA